MEKMDGKTMDILAENVGKLKGLFPEAFTENGTTEGTEGHGKKIDFEVLKELLGEYVSDKDERYSFTWNGKSKARMIAQTPSTGTLRPCKEESVDWDTTQNIFIEGDNLEVLKLLQKSYHKKVKMIYIDPPYNTGKDFVYKDNFKDNIKNYKEITGQEDGEGRNLSNNPETSGRYHTDWLNMMYPRLKLARNLLKDDGVIFISIDENELKNLRAVCDELFGEENFVSTIVWEKRYSPQNAVKWFSEAHDFLLVYTKNKLNWYPNLLERSAAMNARYRNPDNDPRGVWKPENATVQAGHGTKSQFYILTAPNGKQHILPNGRCWVYTESVFQQKVADNRIWFGVDGNNVPAVKRFLSEVKQGTACQTIWKYCDVGHNQEEKKEVNDLFGEADPSVFSVSFVVKKIDLGFKVFKLDSTNIKPWEVDFDMTERTLEDFISNIKSDRREEDVLYEVLLKYGPDLTLPITEHAIAKLKDEFNPEIMRVVFKDSGFKDDVVKTNAVQILRTVGIVDVRSL